VFVVLICDTVKLFGVIVQLISRLN